MMVKQATDWFQNLVVNVRCPYCGCYLEVPFKRVADYGDDVDCYNCDHGFELGDKA